MKNDQVAGLHTARANVGPRKTRERDGEPPDVKILPLRLETNVADQMDEAWRAKGIKNRRGRQGGSAQEIRNLVGVRVTREAPGDRLGRHRSR